jgi:glucose-6-phosphate 1-dehydrogenase
MKDKTIFVIFGSTGDLMRRKLIPALYNLDVHNKIGCEVEILAVGRRPLTSQDYIEEFVKPAFNEFVCEKKANCKNFIKKIDYVHVDFEDAETFHMIKGMIERKAQCCQAQVIYYLSVPPSLFSPIIKNITNFFI